MLIKVALDVAVDVTRALKEQHVARGYRRGETDLGPVIACYRGQCAAALVFPTAGGAQEFVSLARVAAGGFDADLLSAATDTLTSSLRESPATGAAWKPGEMQDVAERLDGRARGWVHDAIAVVAVNRAGDCALRIVPYRVTGPHTVWDDSYSSEQIDQPEGYLPDGLRAIMREPGIDAEMSKRGVRVDCDDEEQARAAVDCATVRAIQDRLGMHAAVALVAERGSKREEYIGRSFGDRVTVVPLRQQRPEAN